MNVSDAIAARRSIRLFSDRVITRAEIEQILYDANLAPNHRLTQPWRFRVLGPDARAAYGAALGERKAKRAGNAEEADRIRRDTVEKHRSLPAMIVVSMTMSDNAEILEEDYAATMMAIENLSLSAVSMGLGSAIRTGAVMADPAAKRAAHVPDSERIVAVIELGEAREVPPPKPRRPASEVTIWVD